VRDRMVGVSLGVLMPLLVFDSFGLSPLSTAVVMGGTAALVVALQGEAYLRTALISSGVAFVGYGPLVAWYIPHRWLDYLLGSALAVAAGLLFRPTSALQQYRALLRRSPVAQDAARRLYPAALEEARWTGQVPPAFPPVPGPPAQATPVRP
jgi:uncharacterized membrane protein YgaE (UPF0421/DUF939 family)